MDILWKVSITDVMTSREKTQGQALLVGGVGLAGNGIMPTSIFFLRSLSTLRDTRAVEPRPYPVV
jgi:hypothetical protein